jgi:GNAT superfamily N-acetyltransferase
MIRSMESRDKEAILDLLQETDMFTPAEVAVAEEIMDIYLTRPDQTDYGVVVVENADGGVAGYMSYDLYWMAVAPKEQGRGHGKTLVKWLEDQVKSWDGRMIIIETSSQLKYHPTREFYMRLGYKEVARVPDFYKPGDDRIIYVKYF